MSVENCEHCNQANDKLSASKDRAYREGAIWAKKEGQTKFAIVLTINRNSWKHVPFDEPNIDRFPAKQYCYL